MKKWMISVLVVIFVGSFTLNTDSLNRRTIMADQNFGVYWIGQDNNVWSKDPYSGVKNLGSTQNFDETTLNALNNRYSQIQDPNAAGPNNSASSTSKSGGSGGGLSASDSAAYDYQTGQLRNQLESSNNTLNNGLTQINDSYNQGVSSANKNRSRALEDYETQGVNDQMKKQDNLGQVDTNARTLSNSLRRIIGQAGGSNSSAYNVTAPYAVARDASGNRNNVLETFGQNQMAVDTSKKRATEDFATLLQSLSDQKAQKESGLRSGILSQQQQIEGSLAQLAQQRASATGGNVAAALAPYSQAINDRQSQIDNLFNQFRTPYDIKPVNVEAAKLSDYMVNKSNINANRQAGTTGDPYAQYLNPLKKKEQLA